MDTAEILSIIAIFVSIVAIFIPIRLYGKNIVLAEKYQLIYEDFSKKIDSLLREKNLETSTVEKVKDFICNEIKPAFSFIRFRNSKKYDCIKNILNEIENYVCKLIEAEDNFECRKKLSFQMEKFYKTLDKYFHFVK